MVLSLKAKTLKWSFGVLSLFTLVISLALFPIIKAEAATILLELTEKRIQQDKAFVSVPVNAANYKDITFSFNYDATALDGFATTTGHDKFFYGWQIGDSEKQILGTVLGLSGSTTEEHGLVNVVLPETASVENLVLFIEVSANSTSTSDKVEVRNISVSGNLKENSETEPTPEPADLCLNLEGVQTEIPTGYESNIPGNCAETIIETEPMDLCPNLEENQAIIPEGYEKSIQGDCVPVPPSVVDVCPNLDGVQNEVPANYKHDSVGKCIPVVVETKPKPEVLVCPKGYARWVNKFTGGTIWQADDVYQSVILVGRNDNKRRNFSLNRQQQIFNFHHNIITIIFNYTKFKG